MTHSVVVFVFDGLQRVQVTPELMPNLTAFSAQGVTFESHHSAYPTVTRGNVVTMTTGRYPGGHGLTANLLVVPEFDPDRAVPALMPQLAEIAEQTGRLLLAPNLADILGARGEEFVAVGVGSSGNAYLQNPNALRSGGATIHPDFCLPESLHDELVSRLGPWPQASVPNTDRLSHAVRIMTEYVLPEREPAVALLWCSEPDSSQHRAGVASELTTRGLSEADRQFGRLLHWLDESGRAADTDVLVLSDHGHSTSKGRVDIERLVRGAGFPPGAQPGGVVVAANGGSTLFYINGHDRATAGRLAQWLMAQPWCGAIVASEAMGGIPGSLPSSLVGLDGPRAPDLAMSFTWDARPNRAGIAGHAYCTQTAPGLGSHGSMSAQELHCFLAVRGPSIKRGLRLQTPSGNVDLAPTVLRILGIEGGGDMEGRVLDEALVGGPDAASVTWATTVHEAERSVDGGTYRQQITVTEVGATRYLDQGNARCPRK